MKKLDKQQRIRAMEEQFYRQINQVISERITPIYNFFIIVFAIIFGYFVVFEQNQCYSKNMEAFGMQYSNTEDVTEQFYWVSVSGMFLLLLSAYLYYLQSREDQFDKMRPFVIINNLVMLGWFGALQYIRFKDAGRACSGDFQIWANQNGDNTTI